MKSDKTGNKTKKERVKVDTNNNISNETLRNMTPLRLELLLKEHKVHDGYLSIGESEKFNVNHNLETFPYPFESDIFSVILCSHVMNKIKPWNQINVINELWRILKIDGLLLVALPHENSFQYKQDPLNCGHWNEATPYMFTPESNLYNILSPNPFKIEQMQYDKHRNIEVAFRKIAKRCEQ